jgi:tetrahydromethanopterin S-methyltransferase subunit B
VSFWTKEKSPVNKYFAGIINSIVYGIVIAGGLIVIDLITNIIGIIFHLR